MLSSTTPTLRLILAVLLISGCGQTVALDWRYLPESDQGIYRPILDPPLNQKANSYPNGLPGQRSTLKLRPTPQGLRDIFRVGVRTGREEAFEEDRSAVRLASRDMDQSRARQAELPAGSQVPDLFQDAFSDIPLTLDFGILIRF